MDELAVTAAIVLVVFAVHAVFAVYLYRSLIGAESSGTEDAGVRESLPDLGRRDRGADAAASQPADPVEDASERTVSCPTCGARNAPEFRFCRRCVSDLSNATAPSGGRGSTGLGG
jgi:hypothetical protein